MPASTTPMFRDVQAAHAAWRALLCCGSTSWRPRRRCFSKRRCGLHAWSKACLVNKRTHARAVRYTTLEQRVTSADIALQRLRRAERTRSPEISIASTTATSSTCVGFVLMVLALPPSAFSKTTLICFNAASRRQRLANESARRAGDAPGCTVFHAGEPLRVLTAVAKTRHSAKNWCKPSALAAISAAGAKRTTKAASMRQPAASSRQRASSSLTGVSQEARAVLGGPRAQTSARARGPSHWSPGGPRYARLATR